MNNAYKVMSLEGKSPVQPSSPHRFLQALGLQWNGSKAQSPRQGCCISQKELSDVDV